MAVNRPRNRVVYFRLSEEEFKRYCRICETRGARSLSDLARAAVGQLLEETDSTASEAIGKRFAAIEEKLDSVAAALDEVRMCMSGTRKTGSPDGAA